MKRFRSALEQVCWHLVFARCFPVSHSRDVPFEFFESFHRVTDGLVVWNGAVSKDTSVREEGSVLDIISIGPEMLSIHAHTVSVLTEMVKLSAFSRAIFL